jgi:hypothetical protein
VINQRVHPVDVPATESGTPEPAEAELGTFADVENGEPEDSFDDVVPDTAIV